MRLIAFLAIFLLIGAFFIVSEKNLNITKSEDLASLKTEYGDWIVHTLKGSAKFVGQVVKMDWLPSFDENLTNSSQNKT